VAHPLPDDAASAIVTDPPYYDAVPYAHLSDFFYVWLRRSISAQYSELFSDSQVAKESEIVVDRPHELSNSTHDIAFYERELAKAFSESRRVLRPDGIGTIVFASKTTASWEAILKAVVDAGWIITGSWPIDTEREARIAAQGQARLASSVHLVCRPRENPDGSVRIDAVGDWRDVLAELPHRIHNWMPRLAAEGVVGADGIFACLGPALEIFSRYSRVEKASGEVVTLKEYLEQVWAAVSKEALSLVFEGADTAGFEPDARLTAMWLWTLNAGASADAGSAGETVGDAADDEDSGGKAKPRGGFTLEYDAARKIAQGLGAHLEELSHLVEIKGDQARLLPVSERTKHLFGKEEAQAPARGRGKKNPVQGDLFADLREAERETGWGVAGTPEAGETVLDRIHQIMILFAAGRSEALKRFLVEEGAGRGQRFWSLAQALSALYPNSTDEKRWVDGVLARKKSFGF
jgi:putative DNA methylase